MPDNYEENDRENRFGILKTVSFPIIDLLEEFQAIHLAEEQLRPPIPGIYAHGRIEPILKKDQHAIVEVSDSYARLIRQNYKPDTIEPVYLLVRSSDFITDDLTIGFPFSNYLVTLPENSGPLESLFTLVENTGTRFTQVKKKNVRYYPRTLFSKMCVDMKTVGLQPYVPYRAGRIALSLFSDVLLECLTVPLQTPVMEISGEFVDEVHCSLRESSLRKNLINTLAQLFKRHAGVDLIEFFERVVGKFNTHRFSLTIEKNHLIIKMGIDHYAFLYHERAEREQFNSEKD